MKNIDIYRYLIKNMKNIDIYRYLHKNKYQYYNFQEIQTFYKLL